MPQIVDLTNPQGKYSGSFNAIAGILDSIGKVERLRQERSLNAKIINVVATGGGPQQIAQVLTENQPQYSTGAVGFLQQLAAGFAPPSAIEGQVGQGLMQQAFQDPLDREYKQAQIGSAKALTRQREEEAKQALPDRMLRQADRYLRVVDDIMSEYWYTPEGPYRDKLLKDAQTSREKAIKLIEKYGATSEAGKVSMQQLRNIDEEIKKAGGKVEPIKESPIQPTPKKGAEPSISEKAAETKRLTDILSTYHRESGGKPTKEVFDSTLSHISSEEAKDIYFEMFWRPEFGK